MKIKPLICFILIMLTVVVLNSCTSSVPGSSEPISSITETTSPSKTTSTTIQKNVWEVGKYIGDVIPDEATAIKVADIIFTDVLKKSKDSYPITHVNYNELNETWKVLYIVDEERLGDAYCIELSQRTGEILKIEYGE